MLSEICFQQIKDNYWYAAYGEFRVIMDKSNGYINATKMCKDGGKDYKNWSRLNGSRELINAVQLDVALENSHDIPPSTLGDYQGSDLSLGKLVCKSIITQKKSDIEKLISGTYCHPLLIPHIGSWISVNFAVNVSKVVNAYIERQYKDHIHDMEIQLEICTAAELKHKQAKLEAIEAKEEAIQQCDAAKLVAHQQLQQTQQLEKAVKTKKLQLDTWGNSHAFTMMRLNENNTKPSYYAIRRKRNSMPNAVKRLRKKYPNSIAVFQSINVPNPINLYNRLKSSGVLLFNGNYCSSKVNESELITKLGQLYSVIE
jgi:KilA-N domain/Protein of unknown function (DUF3627)